MKGYNYAHHKYHRALHRDAPGSPQDSQVLERISLDHHQVSLHTDRYAPSAGATTCCLDVPRPIMAIIDRVD